MSWARLLVLALLPSARAAWLEISQQHYRKPLRLTDVHTDFKHELQEPTRDTFVHIEDRWERNEPENKWNTANQKNIYQDRTRDPILDHKEHRWHIQDRYLPNGLKNIDGYPMKHVDSDPLRNVTRKYLAEDRPVVLNHNQDDTRTSNRNAFITKEDTRPTYFQEVSQSERNPYLNQSLTEHKWGQHAYRPKNKGETKWTDEDLDDWNNNADYSTNRYEATEIKNVDERSKYEERDLSEPVKGETVSGKIERIPNIGSVQRVQLANTPVKSPSVKVPNLKKIIEADNRRNQYDELRDEFDVTTDVFTYRKDTKIPNSKNTYSSIEAMTNMNHGDMKHLVQNSTVYFQKHYFTQKPDLVTQIKKGVKNHKETKSPELTISEADHYANIAIDMSDQTKEDFSSSKNNNRPDLPVHQFETSTHKHDNNIENEKNQNKLRGSVKIEKATKEQIESSEKDDSPSSGEIKVNTMEKILRLMKLVAGTISTSTRNGANGKVAYLNELKHALLANIKGRIDATWPDDPDPRPPPAGHRRSRAASPRGHVEIPSSESALMTISFLTFAVFLIKLVLQVIQTYKHKAMLMAPLMVSTAGRAGRAGHKLRDSH